MNAKVTGVAFAALVALSVPAETNPWSHLNFQDDPGDFRFAIVPDRGGGDYRGAFTNALECCNRMHPTFVMTVGDLINGYAGWAGGYKRQQDELTNFVSRVRAPFFYTIGNHDINVNLPPDYPKNYEMSSAAWQLADPQGFAARFGLTFPERRAKGFAIDYRGHECKWNGPSWPFATSIALTALANDIHAAGRRAEDARRREPDLFTTLLRQYAAAQTLRRPDGTVVPWIDENLHPDRPEWISRRIILETPSKRGKFPKERGKDYNHSTFCDLVISGLVGFLPDGAKGFAVDPLFPETWDCLVLENLRYRGHDVDVRWHRGEGLSVSVDGKAVASRPGLGRLNVAFSECLTDRKGR